LLVADLLPIEAPHRPARSYAKLPIREGTGKQLPITPANQEPRPTGATRASVKGPPRFSWAFLLALAKRLCDAPRGLLALGAASYELPRHWAGFALVDPGRRSAGLTRAR